MAAMTAVAVTGPMPGMATSLCRLRFREQSSGSPHRFFDPQIQVIELQLQLGQQHAQGAG